MPDEFKYRRPSQELVVNGTALSSEDGLSWTAPYELVANASLSSLARAYRDEYDELRGGTADEYEQWGMPMTMGGLTVADVPADEFDPDYLVIEPWNIGYLREHGVVIDVIVEPPDAGLDDAELEAFLGPTLRRMGAKYLGSGTEGTGHRQMSAVRVALTRRGATVARARDIAAAVSTLVDNLANGAFDANSVLQVVRAGRADLLIGMIESQWLEAKSQLHPIATTAGCIELGQDVSRFANSQQAATIVIGPVTKRRGGRDTITSLRASPAQYDVARIARAIDQRVFPPIEGLVVEDTEVTNSDGTTGHVLAIHIPAQPEEHKPFLVHGAIVDGRVEGAFISIVQRRGEDSVPVRAESIHTALAVGRALLRGATRK
ncbi:helix-turn-helix domain-containing protein [Pimelobacter simplex]|uniref:AlbA family DNA-binding domain-containing protein n=1 Tax=Nocardioides simplex TaxID=2045 RepID=UPI003825B190